MQIFAYLKKMTLFEGWN